MTYVIALLFFAIAGKMFACSAKVPDAIKFIGFGYNIIDGNPFGDRETSADPGIISKSILALTYKESRLSSNQNYQLPDQVDFMERKSCLDRMDAKILKGSRDYQNDLSVFVEVGGGYSGDFADVQFTASAGYKTVNTGAESDEKIYLSKVSTCHLGDAIYTTPLGMSDVGYNLDPNFLSSLNELPSDPKDKAYGEFFDAWGTHVIYGIRAGSRSSEVKETTRKEATRYAKKNLDLKISSSGEIGKASYSVEFNTATMAMDKKFTSLFDMTMTTSFIGSDIKWDSKAKEWVWPTSAADLQEPIHVKIMPIFTVINTNLGHYKANLEAALKLYPDYRSAKRSKQSDGLGFDVQWPDQPFALLSAERCPSGSSGTWNRFVFLQDTEGGSSNTDAYTYDFLTLVNGAYNAGFMLSYCSYTPNVVGENHFWPEGKYCILRLKGNCPQGFREGKIHWDDEDTGNRNRIVVGEGNQPDGKFDKDTTIYFCCRNDNTEEMMFLPTEDPFTLYVMEQGYCPKVYGMDSRLLYYFTDDEDNANEDSRVGVHPYAGTEEVNTRLQICHYQETPPSQYKASILG